MFRWMKISFVVMITGIFFSLNAGASQDTVQGYGYIEPETELLQEDFQSLYDENEHIIGWLQAGGNIDYPVVQYDNDYYLHHDYYGQEDINGTLFVNKFNLLWPRDWLVIIHGHHMRSGAMFGRLMEYEDYSYACQYPLILFRTIYDDKDVYYAPIAAFNASMEETDPEYFFVMEPWFFYEEEVEKMAQTEVPERHTEESESGTEKAESDTEERNRRINARKEQYLQSMMDLSIWETPLEVTADDELLMLSTCSYYQQDGRFMLVCRKLREDETPEMINELFGLFSF